VDIQPVVLIGSLSKIKLAFCSKLVVLQYMQKNQVVLFSVLYCAVYAHKFRLAKMAKFNLQVRYKQSSLALIHVCNYLSCSTIEMWNLLCKTGVGDVTISFCFHTSGGHCHPGRNSTHTPYS